MQPVELGKLVISLGLTCAFGYAQAQWGSVDPDWKEAELAAMPPPIRTDALIAIEGASFSGLKLGIDPQSISLAADGVVRYVVIAESPSGARNALFEGIRCSTGEYKVYARHAGDSWNPASKIEWRQLQDPQPSRHTLTLARTGLCLGNAPNGPVSKMLRDLRSPVDRRFLNQ